MTQSSAPIDTLDALEASRGFLSTVEAGRLLGVNPCSLWRWNRYGRDFPDGIRRYLPAMQIGRKTVYLKEDLAAWIDLMSMRLPRQKPVKAATKRSTKKVLEKAGIRKASRK